MVYNITYLTLKIASVHVRLYAFLWLSRTKYTKWQLDSLTIVILGISHHAILV